MSHMTYKPGPMRSEVFGWEGLCLWKLLAPNDESATSIANGITTRQLAPACPPESQCAM